VSDPKRHEQQLGEQAMAAIAKALPLPWTVEVTFRTLAGEKVFTWHAPCQVTAIDDTVDINLDLGSVAANFSQGETSG